MLNEYIPARSGAVELRTRWRQPGSVARRAGRHGTAWRCAVAAVLACSLGGCAGSGPDGSPGIGSGPAGSSTSAATTPAQDVQPTPDPNDSPQPSGGPAFEVRTQGAPVVKRPGALPQEQRATAPAAAFGSAVVFNDGVKVSTSGFKRGTVSDTGAGVVKGAGYVAIDITLENGTPKPLDASAVVVSLLYDRGKMAAAPLYGSVKAQDFSGLVKSGGKQTATYAFQLPENAGKAALYVDIDGAHIPAAVTGELP